MNVKIVVPTPLRKLTGGANEVSVSPGTVREVIEGIDKLHSGFQERLYDEAGSLRTFLKLFVNQADIRGLGGLDTPVGSGDTLTITMALAGG